MSHEKSRYIHTWHLRGVTSSPEQIMALFQQEPTQVFPFPLKPIKGGKPSIQEGTQLYLRPMLVKREPVQVDHADETSFRFRTLPGHWHREGATITFSVTSNSQGLSLRQEAEFGKKWYYPAYSLSAGILWYAQAKKLTHLVRKNERRNAKRPKEPLH